MLFHCTASVVRATKKSKHGVGAKCKTVKQVLSGNPKYGLVITRRDGLRKMRISVPGFGKSSGYRLIYSVKNIDEEWYVILHRIYFKSDKEDLSDNEYKIVVNEDEDIWSNPILTDFE